MSVVMCYDKDIMEMLIIWHSEIVEVSLNNNTQYELNRGGSPCIIQKPKSLHMYTNWHRRSYLGSALDLPIESTNKVIISWSRIEHIVWVRMLLVVRFIMYFILY